MKYRISRIEFRRVEPKRTPEGSGYNLLYILTCVITQELLVSKKIQYWLPFEGSTDIVDSGDLLFSRGSNSGL